MDQLKAFDAINRDLLLVKLKECAGQYSVLI